jgi:hypothetical protein
MENKFLLAQEMKKIYKINKAVRANHINKIILKSIQEQKLKKLENKKIINKSIQVNLTETNCFKREGNRNKTSNLEKPNIKILEFKNSKTVILPYINKMTNDKIIPYYFEKLLERKKGLRTIENETLNTVITNSYNTIDLA